MGSGRPKNLDSNGKIPKIKRGYKLCPCCGKGVPNNRECTCLMKQAHKMRHKTMYEQKMCPECRARRRCTLYNQELVCRG